MHAAVAPDAKQSPSRLKIAFLRGCFIAYRLASVMLTVDYRLGLGDAPSRAAIQSLAHHCCHPDPVAITEHIILIIDRSHRFIIVFVCLGTEHAVHQTSK